MYFKFKVYFSSVLHTATVPFSFIYVIRRQCLSNTGLDAETRHSTATAVGCGARKWLAVATGVHVLYDFAAIVVRDSAYIGCTTFLVMSACLTCMSSAQRLLVVFDLGYHLSSESLKTFRIMNHCVIINSTLSSIADSDSSKVYYGLKHVQVSETERK